MKLDTKMQLISLEINMSKSINFFFEVNGLKSFCHLFLFIEKDPNNSHASIICSKLPLTIFERQKEILKKT